MKSHELWQEMLRKHGAKRIASAAGTRLMYFYKWCQPDGGRSVGGLNPLERLAGVMRETGDLQPLHWLCEQFGGYFVLNPANGKHHAKDLMTEENHLMTDVGRMLQLIGRAAEDMVITPQEAAAIRKEWERLKSLTEGFVVNCEHGDFQSLRSALK